MPKRISKDDFDQRMKALRAAYVQDIEAAGGDSGKVDLAAKKYEWGEEAARDAFSQRSGFYKFFDSIPLIGKPIAIILDSVAKGIDKHGPVLGLARGLFIGLIIAAALIALSEGIPPFYDLGRNWLNLHYFFHIQSEQRTTAVDAATNQELAAYYARHPDEDPSKRGDSKASPAARNPDPNRADHAPSTTDAEASRELAAYYARHPEEDPSKRGDSKASPAARNRTNRAVTVSPDVLFVETSVTQYQHTAEGNPTSILVTQSLTMYFDTDAEPGAQKLPQGTPYKPYLKDPDNLESVVTLVGPDGKYPAILATVENADGSNKRYGLILKSEYEAYLRSQKR